MVSIIVCGHFTKFNDKSFFIIKEKFLIYITSIYIENDIYYVEKI